MRLKKRLGGLGLVLAFVLLLVSPVLAEEKSPLTIDGDKISYDSETGDFAAYGNVVAVQQGMTLKSDSLEGNMNTKDIHGYGNVFWQKEKDYFQGDEAFYNYGTEVGSWDKGQGYMDGYFVKTDRIDKDATKAVLQNNSLTSCTAQRIKCYEITAKRMIIYPGEKLVAYDASFYVRGKKIFSLKQYKASLKEKDKKEAGLPKLGYSSGEGMSLKYKQYLTLSDDNKKSSFIALNYYTRLGAHFQYQADQDNAKDHWTFFAGKDLDDDDIQLETLPQISWSRKTQKIAGTSLSYSLGASVGHFAQEDDGFDASAWRTTGNIRIANDPIPLSSKTNLNLWTAYQKNWYSDEHQLGIFSTGIGINQQLSNRGNLGVNYVHRQISGGTPFNFDDPGDANVLYTNLDYKIDKLWRIGVSSEYNLDTSKFEELDYTVIRNLHCFETKLTWRDKRDELKVSVDLIKF